jgi:glycine cleavage system T protein (aminomethyltransferase)
MSSTAALRHTPLYEQHRSAGARLVPFAGWEMPIQYTGIRAEHQAVRNHAGMFDVSHMGQIETRGPQAFEFLQRLLSNDLRRLPEGGAQYSVLCNEEGHVLDDLFTYRLAERHFLTVTNAANHERDLDWFRAQAAGYDVDVIDKADDFAMLAVQGPEATRIVAGLADTPLPPRMRAGEPLIAGIPVLACATGYTGEDGFELLISPAEAPAVWDALLDAGVTPVGLGARDTLRLEVCFHLYGNDLDLEHGPIEAGLGWCCKEATGFIGSEAVAAARANPPPEQLVPFVIEGEGIARAGNPVLGGGVVTSGTFSPSLERGIGMAYVSAEHAQPGTAIEIDVRGKTRSARIEQKPLYKKGA